MQETTVVLGVEDPALQEEVLHFLDRLPAVRVVGAGGDGGTTARTIRDAAPDVAVVSPAVLRSTPDLDGAAVFVVAERETTEALRWALRASARGFYLWPEERESLARDAERAARPRSPEKRQPGRVIAVYGARGGAGVTFLATNLAAACGSRGAESVVVDLDPFHGDVAGALGISSHGTPTLADLMQVLDELTPEHVDRVLYAHPKGFRALLAPPEPGVAEPLPPDHVSALIRLLRTRFDICLLHLPRTMDASVRAAVETADEIFLVVTLDVLAFRHTRRMLSWLSSLGLERNCRLVVNRASTSDVVPEDAQRVFGISPFAVIRRDRSVSRAQDRGELVAGRSGTAARQVAAVAKRLMEGQR